MVEIVHYGNPKQSCICMYRRDHPLQSVSHERLVVSHNFGQNSVMEPRIAHLHLSPWKGILLSPSAPRGMMLCIFLEGVTNYTGSGRVFSRSGI